MTTEQVKEQVLSWIEECELMKEIAVEEGDDSTSDAQSFMKIAYERVLYLINNDY